MIAPGTNAYTPDAPDTLDSLVIAIEVLKEAVEMLDAAEKAYTLADRSGRQTSRRIDLKMAERTAEYTVIAAARNLVAAVALRDAETV